MNLIPVYMPKFGMTMTHGIIVKWHRAEGERIQAGEALMSVETEKVVGEVEAPATGTIVELSYAEEDEVAVGEVIAYIEEAE